MLILICKIRDGATQVARAADGIVMDYLGAKFGNFSFSRFVNTNYIATSGVCSAE